MSLCRLHEPRCSEAEANDDRVALALAGLSEGETDVVLVRHRVRHCLPAGIADAVEDRLEVRCQLVPLGEHVGDRRVTTGVDLCGGPGLAGHAVEPTVQRV